MKQESIIDDQIIDIVQNQQIKEQSELQNSLRLRGYKIPQATLSRRLKKLKIVKIDGIYKAIDFTQRNLPVILNLTVSDAGLIVIHTHPGQAHSLAYFIDRKYVHYVAGEVSNVGILGTIAGDDTVLVIMQSQRQLLAILKIFKQNFSYLQDSIC